MTASEGQCPLCGEPHGLLFPGHAASTFLQWRKIWGGPNNFTLVSLHTLFILFFSFSVVWLFSLLSNRHWWALPSNKVYCLGDWKPDYPVYPLPRILSLFLLYWVCSLAKGKYLKFLPVLLFIFYLLKGELSQNENLKLSVDSVTVANWSAS